MPPNTLTYPSSVFNSTFSQCLCYSKYHHFTIIFQSLPRLFLFTILSHLPILKDLPVTINQKRNEQDGEGTNKIANISCIILYLCLQLVQKRNSTILLHIANEFYIKLSAKLLIVAIIQLRNA